MMLQDIAPHRFNNTFSHRCPCPNDHVLHFSVDGLSVQILNGRILLPTIQDAQTDSQLQYLFSIDDTAYFWQKSGDIISDCFSAVNTRKLREYLPDHTLFACAAAESLVRWYRSNRFCGCCAAELQHSQTERAMLCPKCGNTVYPKICPAVIVAIYDQNRLVLTKYINRPFQKFALVAGFTEIGESIEQTVHREVLEETGLRVKNLHFYKSQPWVFTDTLLMGFFAELDGSDEIRVQEDELSDADWFVRSDIPDDHSHISLTGEMIEKFRTAGLPFLEDLG